MLVLRDSGSGEEYLQAPSSWAELQLGVPCALPGWREPGGFKEPYLWGSLTSDLVENLQMWQGWAGKEQVRFP